MHEPHPRALVAIGLVTALLAGGLVSLLLAYGRGEFDDRYELSAVFPSSSQGVFTDGGTEVKLRGVRVGTVSGVDLLADGRARLTFAIDDAVAVPASTTARLEPLSVFGPKFVDLDPGDGSGGALRPGDELAAATTGTELTDVLDQAASLFAAVDPADLVTVFDAVSTGVSGLGDELGEGLDAGSALVDVAHRRRDLLAEFVPDLRTVSTSIATRSQRFLDRLDDYRAVAAIAAENGDDVDALLDAMAVVSFRSSTLLRDAAEEFDLTVRATADVLRGIYRERHLIPKAFDTVGAFFDMLGAGMRLPGPDGTKLTALKGFVTVDLCLVFGVCVLPDGGLSAPPVPPIIGPELPDLPDILPGDDPAGITGITDIVDALIDPPVRRP
jgi:phospholipid/cholesterol/gamma-HCH transport system substrate-binding protein